MDDKVLLIIYQFNIKTHDDEWLKWRVYGIYCRTKNASRLSEFI